MRKMTLISAFLIMISGGCILTHDVDTGRLELPALADDDYLIDYLGYTSSYDMKTKTPEWVAYELTAEETDGRAQRDGKFFRRDDTVLLPQPDDYDYRGSGWTRGHLAPAADFRWSDEAMWETFHFTNCCPQDEDLNNGMWNTLEKKCRSWARKHGKIYIVTGPIKGSNRYGTIGSNRVTVPDAFFKAILMNDGKGYKAIAFIMQNKPQNDNLQGCAMSVDELEKKINLDLFPALEDGQEEVAERTFSLKDWRL